MSLVIWTNSLLNIKLPLILKSIRGNMIENDEIKIKGKVENR